MSDEGRFEVMPARLYEHVKNYPITKYFPRHELALADIIKQCYFTYFRTFHSMPPNAMSSTLSRCAQNRSKCDFPS